MSASTAEVFPFPQDPEHSKNGQDGSRPPGRRPRSKHTKSAAVRGGLCDKAQYDRVEPLVEDTIDHYYETDVPRSKWIPIMVTVLVLCRFWINRGQEVLRASLETLVDPMLDEIAESVESIRNRLDALAEFPRRIYSLEGNVAYDGHDAVSHVVGLNERIEQDRAAGLHHHDRVHPALRTLGKMAPYLEAFGFAVFAMYFLNVPLLAPWMDWLGWSFAIVIVLGICWILKWSIHHAAEAHNRAREQQVDRQSHEAEASRRNRWFYGIIAVIAAAGITIGMIERGLTSLAGGSLAVTAVMIGLAAITGLLLPVLTYWSIAFDGSSISRERDGMSNDLDDDLEDYLDASAEIEETFTKVASLDEVIVNDELPRIADDVQSEVNGARDDYLFLLVQLSVDTVVPPAAAMTVEHGERGPIGTIATGLPGGSTVDMKPVFDRMSRLQNLRGEIQLLKERRASIPAHPWKGARPE